MSKIYSLNIQNMRNSIYSNMPLVCVHQLPRSVNIYIKENLKVYICQIFGGG